LLSWLKVALSLMIYGAFRNSLPVTLINSNKSF
jgi:hypothetical protein